VNTSPSFGPSSTIATEDEVMMTRLTLVPYFFTEARRPVTPLTAGPVTSEGSTHQKDGRRGVDDAVNVLDDLVVGALGLDVGHERAGNFALILGEAVHDKVACACVRTKENTDERA
jgi:hypothetical protein